MLTSASAPCSPRPVSDAAGLPMGALIHFTLSLCIAGIFLLTRKHQHLYWRVIWLIVGASIVLSPLLGFSAVRSIPLIFGNHRALFLITEAVLLFGVPLLAAAIVVTLARSWRWPFLTLIVSPGTYFAALFISLIVGVNAGLLVP